MDPNVRPIDLEVWSVNGEQRQNYRTIDHGVTSDGRSQKLTVDSITPTLPLRTGLDMIWFVLADRQ